MPILDELRTRKGNRKGNQKSGFQVAGEGLQTIGAILGGRAVPDFQEADAELSFLEKEQIKKELGAEREALEQQNLQSQIDARKPGPFFSPEQIQSLKDLDLGIPLQSAAVTPSPEGGISIGEVKFAKREPLIGNIGNFDPNTFNRGANGQPAQLPPSGGQPSFQQGQQQAQQTQPQSIGQPQQAPQFDDAQIQSMIQDAVAQGVPQEEAQRIAQEIRGSQSNQNQLEAVDISQVRPTQSGIDAALAAGYSEEEINAFLEANARQTGGLL